MKQHFARAIHIDVRRVTCVYAQPVSTSRCEMNINTDDDGKTPGHGSMVAACGNGSDAEQAEAQDTLTAATAPQPPRDVRTPSASLLNVKCEVKSCNILVLRHPNKSETHLCLLCI